MATSTDLRAAIEEVQSQLPAEQLEAAAPGTLAPGWGSRLERRIGALPWWVISTVVHAVIFLLATLLSVAAPAAQVDEVTISSDVARQKPPEYDEKKPRDIFRNVSDIKSDQQVDKPMVIHEEAPVSEQFETANDSDKQSARGQEDAISDIPLGGTGVVGSMGVGGGGMAGCFGYRDGGGRKHAVTRFGGSPATESAAEAALAWLARHQEKDGHWDRKKWADGPDFSGGDVAVTGLATLAFLGAGYTSKAGGKYGDVVRRAETWLCSTLDEATKHHPWSPVKLGDFDTSMYEQGMATLALAEAYGMTRDEKLRKYAQAAIDAVVAAQGPYEGWTYQSKHGKVGRNDTSITGWQVMALKSAKIAGLKVDGNAFQGAVRWLEVATDPATGVCAYESAPTIDKVKRGNGSMSMCAAGMIMHQFLGTPNDSPVVRAAAAQLAKYLPTWDVASVDTTFGPVPGGKNGTNYYYWYYGSLGMFQFGGEHWTKWNAAMKKILVEQQRKGGPLDGTANDVDGSYDPVGSGGVPHGGRVMSTALAALTLEVYYRYLPLYSK